VRELAAPAAMAGDAAASIERVVERWRLLRPGIALERSGELGAASAFALDAGIGHLLLALLNNAADAGERAGRPRVALHLQTESDALRGSVRDYGTGFDAGVAEHSGVLFRSTKRDGLGVGLALSHATVERLGGELSLQRAHDGGTRVAFRLPLRAAVGAAR
jgi:two-component system sensor histidine kinase RegB